MGKKKVTKRKSAKRSTRKARRSVPIRKAQPKKTDNSKKKKQKRKSTPRRNSKRTQKSKSLRVRITGNSTKIKVDSRYAGRNVTVVRKTSRFSPPIRISRGSRGASTLKRILIPPGVRHYHMLGISIKSLYYIRIQYIFKLKGKKVVSHFSIGISKIKNANQFVSYMEDTIESFLASLIGYSRDGFSDMRVTALIVQGYKK